ncbi:restriction endonuclease subunit S [Pseudomonas sp. CC120222-01a]|uniref:restriction endonuclease subunit S n=1 Tax=Pseudomonas sp. CC120222-01a TaxID=1378075 RepID=UPI000D99473B|nr:restriction endonuclease subunit S [Pseudomonas sp. CC120222-01a]PVZ32988.1 type I restriction enzyme S subunit [Pseudomonas sp. CC120222-01a]
MSIPAYSTYKDSSVEWLGEVPTDWVVSKLGYFFREPPCYGVLVPDFENDGVPMLRITDMEHEFIDTSGLVTISAGLSAQYSRTIVKEGDVVLSLVGTIGKAFEVGPKLAGVNLSRAIARIQLDDNTLPRYLCWIFQSRAFTHFIDLVCRGTAQRVLNLSDLSAFSFVFPTYVEQSSISAFLDYETARIDALIEEQQRLIELLKEKRKALISLAVTRGLDPTVLMKDSGVEWLGEVPAHWTIKKGGHIGMLFGSEAVPEGMVNDYGNLPFLKVGSLSSDTLSIRQWDFFVDESIERYYRPKSRFVVFPKRGAAIFLNKVNVVEVGALLDPNLMGWEMQAGNNAYYFASVLKCRGLSELADVSTVPQINNKHISPEKFPVPPYVEQNGIVAFLDTETFKFDQLVTEAEHGVSLLQERRSALVSAAVTGKIDVRNWQPPASAQAPEPAVAEAD